MSGNPVEARIGARVRAYRAGLSQAEVARLMTAGGVKWSQTTVWQVERGERPLRLTEAMALASLLGTSVEQLCGDNRGSHADREIELAQLRKQIEQVRKVINA